MSDNIDSASFYAKKQYEIEKAEKNSAAGYTFDVLGNIEVKRGNYKQALDYFHSAIATPRKNNLDIVFSYAFLAQVYHATGNIDSSIWYAKSILKNPGFSNFPRAVLDALTILARDYKLSSKNDSALKYLELRVALNDSLFTKEKSRAIQALTFNEALQQQEMEAASIQYQNQVKLYAVFALSGLFLLIGVILYRNNKVKQKANILLQQQKEKVESTLSALESAQSQLIQSEKMASLGNLLRVSRMKYRTR
jgi:two-component system, NtrC family, sensor kinase